MPVLGGSIANYLARLQGLYSVELPQALVGEMLELVRACDAQRPGWAILVTNSPPPGVQASSWADILKWRTDDDRVFVWTRSVREPDSSFRSVVKPFITNRFPGDQGGECTLELLADIAVEELWRRHGYDALGAALGTAAEAFRRTARWVSGLLREAFERAGSTPSMHWSDRFLVHWARLLDQLDAGLAALSMRPEPRHAWELLRLSGFPVPAKLTGAGNPFLSEPDPEKLGEHLWHSTVIAWEEIVDEELRPEGRSGVLLAALDRRAAGEVKVSPWRGLPWDIVQSLSTDLAAPEIGAAVFAAVESPSMLSVNFPRFPVAPVPSWWGVTDQMVAEALDDAREAITFQPVPTSLGLISIVSPGPVAYWLDTRIGTIMQDRSGRRWAAEVTVPGVELIYRENWRRLLIDSVTPQVAVNGDAWIEPGSVELRISGRAVAITQLPPSEGPQGELLIRCEIGVTYTASLAGDGTSVGIGNWDAPRSLRLVAKVRSFDNGSWGPARNITATFGLVVPSPFGPTVVVLRENKLLVAPDSGDDFTADLDAAGNWQVSATPDLLLEEEGTFQVRVYDGGISPTGPRFASVIQVTLSDSTLPTLAPGHWGGQLDLDERDIIAAEWPGSSADVAVVKVRERAGNFSSGILSAVNGRPAGRKPPSSQARTSLLGRYQVGVAQALSAVPLGALPSTLHQCVISTTSTPLSWPTLWNTPDPILLFDRPPGFSLPGIGDGPSPQLVGCAEWAEHMAALARVCDSIGLAPGNEDYWLSGFDPAAIPASVIREYSETHRKLVRAAKEYGKSDAFWASYPLSVLIIEGRTGEGFGQLLAVLLSPLHPARLAWAFSVAYTARATRLGPSILGFSEGWNIPYVGWSVNLAGQAIPLVAVPTDPGEEQDFTTWSALAVLSNMGRAELPTLAAGLPLPWGGRTGINQKVIERAVTDFLTAHPHANALEVDLRSVSETPRSQEIDDAVLRFVGTDELDEVERLSGGTRVWDSEQRLGMPPPRDALLRLRLQLRRDTGKGKPFEWRRYRPTQVPTSADVAFVENANVNLAIVPGTSSGVMGPLPLRRFCPPDLDSRTLDQQYSMEDDDDLLGLSGLLAEIEGTPGEQSALRSSPRPNDLGLGLGARWEVLGTFNLDPRLLSDMATAVSTGQPTERRLLWEWRPSWLGHGRPDATALSGRPYFVVARVPPSLLEALKQRQGLTEGQADEMLAELGYRGIGLASLYAAGGRHESEAAGFFYALRLLLPPTGHPLPAVWAAGDGRTTFTGLLPVDPVYGILAELSGTPSGQRRADLLIVRVTRDNQGLVRICLVPVEIKHHGSQREPEPLPTDTNQELVRARQQLAEMPRLLTKLVALLQPQAGQTEVIACHARRLGFAVLLDLALGFSQVRVNAEARADVVRSVLNGRASVGVAPALLLWFAPGTIAMTGAACVVDPNTTALANSRLREVFVDPAALPALWWGSSVPGADERSARTIVDDLMTEILSECGEDVGNVEDSREMLARAIGLVTDASNEGSQEESNTEPPEDARGSERSEALEQVNPYPLEDYASPPSTDPAGQRGAGHDSSLGSHLHEQGNRVNALVRSESHSIADRQSLEPPRTFAGWTEATSRWALLGNLASTREPVALDYDHPKVIGIFGYMGSGKSYLLGDLVEAALAPIPGINRLPAPLAVIIFNYRRNASDRFELASLAQPNENADDIQRLAAEYSAAPQALRDLHVVRLPGQLDAARTAEYAGLPTTELFFDPATLTVEDWELLMGEPGSEAVFARAVRHALAELRSSGTITLEGLEEQVSLLLSGQSLSAAQLRFRIVGRFLSVERGMHFDQLFRPGRAVIVDLRDPLFTKENALRFFLVCANFASRVQGQFNKLVVFDEAHEYLSPEFGERIESRVRQMRHEGTSYIFATQDVGSIPTGIRRFISTKFVFGLGSRQNADDLVRFAPEFRNLQLMGMPPGRCLLQANLSANSLFERPREIVVRPRVTQHGGASRIFSTGIQQSDD